MRTSPEQSRNREEAAKELRWATSVVCLLIAGAGLAGYSTRFFWRAPDTLASREPLSIDLNHDDLPDSVAIVSDGDGGETIQVKLSGPAYRELKFKRTERHSRSFVYAVDVDHDTNLDLVSESEDGFEPPIVWLGDGKGNFVRFTAPGPPAGDFYIPPTLPGHPGSPRDSRDGITWLRSPAANRPRARLAKRSSDSNRFPSAPGEAPRWRAMAVNTRRELLCWISRTINAPPEPAPSA